MPDPSGELRLLRSATSRTSYHFLLDTAPEDDEPETPEERAAVEEALREVEEGESGLTSEELKRELGIG